MFLAAAVLILLGMGCKTSDRISEEEFAWPEQIREIKYLSEADSTMQPALFYRPEKTNEALPLLVALHTWSGNYLQKNVCPLRTMVYRQRVGLRTSEFQRPKQNQTGYRLRAGCRRHNQRC